MNENKTELRGERKTRGIIYSKVRNDIKRIEKKMYRVKLSD